MSRRDSRTMTDRFHLVLEGRAILAIAGPERRAFLQGLVSNDVEKIAPDRAIYAALLTAQGRFLHDFTIAEIGEALMIDAEAARLDDLKRRLMLYRLRAKVRIEPAADHAVVALFGDGALAALGLPARAGAARVLASGIVFVDPRTPELGARAIVPRAEIEQARAGFAPADMARYDALRVSLGVPDGSRDMPIEKALVLEYGFEALNGVDWNKGCYIGQELTARMKHRALVRKRLVPVRIQGATPSPGSVIMQDGQEAGEMRGASGGVGLALLKIEAIERSGAVLTADGASLSLASRPG